MFFVRGPSAKGWEAFKSRLKNLGYPEALGLAWRLHDEGESRSRQFAALYLAQMLPAPIYRLRWTRPLLAEAPEEAARHFPELWAESLEAAEFEDGPPEAFLRWALERSPLAEPAERFRLNLGRALAELRAGPPRLEPSFNPEEAGRFLRRKALAIGTRPLGQSLEVALCLDGHLAPHLPPLLRSILARTEGPVFHILARGLTRVWAEDLAETVPAGYKFYFCDEIRYQGRPDLAAWNVTASALDRLLLPYLIEGRALYLDIDVLALESLAELSRLEMSAPLAALPEFSPEALWARRATGFPYFNSGVLLLDGPALRRGKVMPRAIALSEKLHLADQDALNLALEGNYQVLPSRWNRMTALQASSGPALVHWAGPFKPWGQYYVPFQAPWRAFAKAAGLQSRPNSRPK